ncbi:MAG: quinolinate synthase NadA, partial [Methanoregulaceae archaeon]|nr:quinolinate synthase NadA [Methanoregulaceae archaeon]
MPDTKTRYEPDPTGLRRRISELRAEKNAVIVAHNYQLPEVQDIADITGDSLELARAAAETGADVLVFCGVDFMAETAAILSPDLTVLLPAIDAACPMAAMVTPGEVRVMRERFPNSAVVAYVNTSAGVKAECDICCTSANAAGVVESLDEDRVIMLPDRNLADYVRGFTDKEILAWEGFCYVHDRFTAGDVRAARETHPDAEVLAHPECRPEVIDLADHVFSTSGMIRYAESCDARELVIGTETGILHQMRKRAPDVKF